MFKKNVYNIKDYLNNKQASWIIRWSIFYQNGKEVFLLAD